ncbi:MULTISPECIES: DUF2017 domain-containing protein [unclassified Streptomyces]|uniref:DUF2017 domain-containing protein n=1 Tax=unclassified Streptomyces TaxID=2593676 RepID=UPI003824042C
MPGYFESTPGGTAAVALDEVEISILRNLAVQLLELIGPGDGDSGTGDGEPADPFAGLFEDGPTKPPQDPALARLFPDAYEETADSAEFRRFTENDLRARKRGDALAVVRSLDALSPGRRGGAVLTLTEAEALQWLGTLNDLRLTLGSRLEVTDDEENELYHLPDSDERKPLVLAYLWLGGLQESLVATLQV